MNDLLKLKKQLQESLKLIEKNISIDELNQFDEEVYKHINIEKISEICKIFMAKYPEKKELFEKILETIERETSIRKAKDSKNPRNIFTELSNFLYDLGENSLRKQLWDFIETFEKIKDNSWKQDLINFFSDLQKEKLDVESLIDQCLILSQHFYHHPLFAKILNKLNDSTCVKQDFCFLELQEFIDSL